MGESVINRVWLKFQEVHDAVVSLFIEAGRGPLNQTKDPSILKVTRQVSKLLETA